jgi:hypothetical protein
MFLVGGPAFSGTTLLAHLLTQGNAVCLDEPDFHDPRQRHRGIPELQKRFPGSNFPSCPVTPLTYPEAVTLMESCQQSLHPVRLGMKTCNGVFIEYAQEYCKRGYPIVAIVRDIRDALVTPLPDWIGGEAGLNERYRLIWNHRKHFDYWFRYEDLVQAPDRVLLELSRVLKETFTAPLPWAAQEVPQAMLKLERHQLLLHGGIVSDRVGIWRRSNHVFSALTHETARLMGYPS